MTAASLQPLTSFPIGAQHGVMIDLDILCASAQEAAIHLQQDDMEGLCDIYDHMGIPADLRGEATRQFGTAFSLSRLFARNPIFLDAVDPMPADVESVAARLEKLAPLVPSPSSPWTMAHAYADEVRTMQAQDRHAEILPLLETAIHASMRSGDLRAARACLETIAGLGIMIDDPILEIKLAECRMRLNDRTGAQMHMSRVFVAMHRAASFDDHDALLIASARSYLRIGALEGAGILIDTVNDADLRFYMLLEKADALVTFRRTDAAQEHLLETCANEARQAGDRSLRIRRLQAIVDTLVEHGMHSEAKPLLEEMTNDISNLRNEDRDHLAWAAQTMKALAYPVEDIVSLLTDGWLHDDHPDFQDDLCSLARRRSQAHLLRVRWNGKLDDLADELLTA